MALDKFPCRFFLIKHGSTLFHEYGISGGKRDWNESEEDFQSWKDGKTGMPLIDANMRELKETGVALADIDNVARLAESPALY